MKTLFANWLLALVLFAGICWFCWQKDQKQIDGLAGQYGAAAPASAPAQP